MVRIEFNKLKRIQRGGGCENQIKFIRVCFNEGHGSMFSPSNHAAVPGVAVVKSFRPHPRILF